MNKRLITVNCKTERTHAPKDKNKVKVMKSWKVKKDFPVISSSLETVYQEEQNTKYPYERGYHD